MHCCLCISEILILIFKFVQESQGGKKTLASLARTCHLFSSSALDVLWRDLYGFHPLLEICPNVTSLADDTQWSTFRKYAKRVKTLRSYEGEIPARIKQEFISSLQHCPEAYLPLLPNVTKLEWSEHSRNTPNDSCISLLRYFAGPAVATILLSLMRWPPFPDESAVLVDLPSLCPEITSFAIIPRFWWGYEPRREVGEMVTQWPRLRVLRTCAIPQSVMDVLFSRNTLESLHIEYHDSSPIYRGRIPDSVRELTLSVDRPSLCMRFLETAYASPIRLCILVSMDDETDKADNEEIFRLLPRRLDASRLLSLTIQPRSKFRVLPTFCTLELRGSLVSALAVFTALRELDLDRICTAKMCDAEYERLVGSLTRLRSLKLGTANPSMMRPRPAASAGAVIVVLRYCKYLETLHILFDGSVPPPGWSATQTGQMAVPGGIVSRGWGIANRRITELHVGYSPIGDATVDAIAFCLKSAMPCLVRIERIAREKEWAVVQNLLESALPG